MNREEWNSQVAHPLQSWEWGEFRKLRQPIDRMNGMLVVWTKIPFSPWVFGYIPMGRTLRAEDINMLSDLGIERNAIGIRIEPNEVLSTKNEVLKGLRRGRNLFKKKTIILDLSKTEDELLKSMHPKGRYNIKVAQKHGVKVIEDDSDKAIAKYLELMFVGTAKRQKIYAHGPKYHLQMWSQLHQGHEGQAPMARLFCAEYKKKTVACALIFCFKDTVYYAYGASALEHKEVMAPTLLLWEVAMWAKSAGYSNFDLWGLEEGTGFSRFKEQFGGEVIELVGTYDLAINRLLYPLFRLIEEVRWKILRALK